MSDFGVIIVAGGKGKRMKTNLPKQFLELGKVPVLMRTMAQFYKFEPKADIVLVLNGEYVDYWKILCEKYAFNIPHKVTVGGEERFHSVRNGLELVHSKVVAVHDAVRPFVCKEMLVRGLKLALNSGTAVPYILPKSSYRVITDKGNEAIDRSRLRIIQTPQIFSYEILSKAYKTDFSQSFTDDASVVENSGAKIYLYEGSEFNIKLTTPLDFKIAELILEENKEKFDVKFWKK